MSVVSVFVTELVTADFVTALAIQLPGFSQKPRLPQQPVRRAPNGVDFAAKQTIKLSAQ